MTTVNVSSSLMEKLVVMGQDSQGYSRNRFLIPNVANIAGVDVVGSVTMTAEGSGYSTPPNVSFGGPGTGAAGTAVLGFAIASAAVGVAGSYATLPSASATVGTGATFALHMKAVAITSVATGSGYAVNDVLTFNNGTNVTPITIVVQSVSGGAITGFSFDVAFSGNPGDYTALPASPMSQTSSSGAGTGATFNVLWGLLSVTVSAGGQHYDSTTVINVTGGGSTGGGTITKTLASTGGVKAVLMTNNGTGYVSVPSVSFSSGGGTGAAGTAVVNRSAVTTSIAVNLPNTNYAVIPIASQACFASCSNKTVNGFDVTLTPLVGDIDGINTGTMDIVVEFTN